MDHDLVASSRLKYLQKQIEAQLQGKYADITMVNGYLSMVHSILLELIQADFEKNYQPDESIPVIDQKEHDQEDENSSNLDKKQQKQQKQPKIQENHQKIDYESEEETDKLSPITTTNKNESNESNELNESNEQKPPSIQKSQISKFSSPETPLYLEISWSIFHYPVFQFLKHQMTLIKSRKSGNSGSKNDVELRKTNESIIKVIILVRKFYQAVIETFTEDYYNALVPNLVLDAFNIKKSSTSLNLTPEFVKHYNANRVAVLHRCVLYMGDISRYRASLAMPSSKPSRATDPLVNTLKLYLKALEYYKICILLIPSLNQPYNHIGLICNSVNDHYTACYWFLRLCSTRISHFTLGHDNFISTMAKDTYLKVAIDAMRARVISHDEFNSMIMCVVGYHLNTIKTMNGDEIAPRVPYSKLLADVWKRIRDLSWTHIELEYQNQYTSDPYFWTQLLFVLKARDFVPEENLFKYNQFMVTYIMKVLKQATKEYVDATSMLDESLANSFLGNNLVVFGSGQTSAIVVIRLLFSILRSNPFIFNLYKKIVGLNDIVETVQQLLKLEQQSELFNETERNRPQRFYLFHEDVELRDLSLIKFNFKDFADRHLYASEDANLVSGDISRYSKNGVPSFLRLEFDLSISEEEKSAKVKLEVAKYENRLRQSATVENGIALLQWANHAEYDQITGDLVVTGSSKPLRNKAELSKSDYSRESKTVFDKTSENSSLKKVERENQFGGEPFRNGKLYSSLSESVSALKKSKESFKENDKNSRKSTDKETYPKTDKNATRIGDKNATKNNAKIIVKNNHGVAHKDTNKRFEVGSTNLKKDENIASSSEKSPDTGSGVWKTEDIERVLTDEKLLNTEDDQKNKEKKPTKFDGNEKTNGKNPSEEITFKNLTVRELVDYSQFSTGIWLNSSEKRPYSSPQHGTPFLSPELLALIQQHVEGTMQQQVRSPMQNVDPRSSTQTPQDALNQYQGDTMQQLYLSQHAQGPMQQQSGNINQNPVLQPHSSFHSMATGFRFNQFVQPQQDYAMYASQNPLPGLDQTVGTQGAFQWQAPGMQTVQSNVQLYSQPNGQPPYNYQQQNFYNAQQPMSQPMPQPMSQPMSQPMPQNVQSYNAQQPNFQQPTIQQPFLSTMQQQYPGQYLANGTALGPMIHPGQTAPLQTPQGYMQAAQSYPWGRPQNQP